MRLFVRCGKGGKDRFTLLSQTNLNILREYWKIYGPKHPKRTVRRTTCHMLK
jgi:site-specific recombinase XerD